MAYGVCDIKEKIFEKYMWFNHFFSEIRESGRLHRGSMLLYVLVFGSLAFTIMVLGVVSYGLLENQATLSKYNREMAYEIAEAGINYYRWHLAHNSTDYQDGTGAAGPYVHPYQDKDGTTVGHYSLEVGAPPLGSTIVTITSTGWLDSAPASQRVLKARVGFPAYSDYAFLTNSDVWILSNQVVHGKLHSNSGIRFDGMADAPIASAAPTYVCGVYSGCFNEVKPGVWGSGGPTTTLWKFPVPAKDFEIVTTNLAQIKAEAQSAGIYLSSSGNYGWRLEFTADGQIKAYKVNTAFCYRGLEDWTSSWVVYCLDARTFDTPLVYNLPANGYVYVEDNVWVDGVVNGRVTVGVATGKSIIFNGNITYAAKDGCCVLGLIAEQNILIPRDSPDTLEINAAMLAQHGGVKRYYYLGSYKSNLITYGSVISAKRWMWNWVPSGTDITSGYRTVTSTYDANLIFSPPPGFPVGVEYSLISWEEIKK